MPTIARAVAAPSATGSFVRTEIERRDLGPRDVRIDIAYAGICHSDIHTVRGEWGRVTYPLVVGHEIVGTVAEIGSEVTSHAIGERVGVGCIVNSCRECAACLAGQEQHCERGMTGTYAARDRDGSITQGGYSTAIVVDEHFVLRVPESIPYEAAAPLLCAGITTYSPLRHAGVGPGSRVGVVGLGGLGHMGVKLAKALGAEVTVFSTTRAKEEDARRLGADHFVVTREEGAFRPLASSLDFVLNTVSAPIDLDDYLGLLAFDGRLVTVGLPSEPQPLTVRPLFRNRRTLSASNIGGIPETQEMLDFCAEHGVAADVEVVTADDVDSAYERVLASDVRYRFVIDIATLS